MPDPRNVVSLEGLRVERASYKADGVTIVYSASAKGGSAAVGKAVTLSGDSTIALAGDGDRIVGKLAAVEFDGTCAVEDDGYVSLPGGSGAVLTRGLAVVGDLGPANAKGYVRAVDSAVAAELAKCGGCIVDASDTAAVVVKF